MSASFPNRGRLLGGLLAAAAISAVVHPGEARADAHTDALSRCFTGSTTEADRMDFMRWMFMAMSKHPDVSGMSNVSEADRAAANRTVAQLVDRLILNDCRREAIAVLRHDGLDALLDSFEYVGEAAADGLLEHPAVAGSLENFGDHLDSAAWEKFVVESGAADSIVGTAK